MKVTHSPARPENLALPVPESAAARVAGLSRVLPRARRYRGSVARHALSALFALFLGAGAWADTPPDLLLVNGRVNRPGPTTDALHAAGPAAAPAALLVRGGRIAFIGTDAAARARAAPGTRVVDLGGGLVLPGFVDAHVHPATVPDPDVQLDLAGLVTAQDVLNAIDTFARRHPERTWIEGTGWDKLAFLPDGRPPATLLDTVTGDRPALLYDNSGHEAWANTRALTLAGISAATPDPANGRIDRDEAGAPRGLLFEDTAMNLVQERIPPLTTAEQSAALQKALVQMTALGITAFEDAMATPAIASAYESLAREHRLLQRVNLCLPFDPTRDDATQIDDFIAARRRLNVGPLTANCVKLFLDGAASHTLALLAPYSDEPERYGRGGLFIEPARLDRLVTRLDALHFRVHMHAQGDAAVRAGLDAFEAARRANGVRDARHTIAHLWLVDPADLPRFRALGVVANFSPVWSRGDTWELIDAPRLFGPERNRHTFPTRSLLDQGARLVFGTDWPVTELAPLDGLETAVTHRYAGGRDPLGRPDAIWHPWERITIDEAIDAYTRQGAWFLFEEGRRGELRPGRIADLVVLDRDPRTIPAEDIHRAKVRFTVIGGRVVYERSAAP